VDCYFIRARPFAQGCLYDLRMREGNPPAGP
jgi:hypothetical protein